MFENRLSLLREEKNMTKGEVAKALKIPYTTYLNYENDVREPNSETLIKISKFYSVSIDYLLGVTDIKTTDVDVIAIRGATGLSELAIVNLKKFCISSPFGMIYLNKLLENLKTPYEKDTSIMYEIILYLHYKHCNEPKRYGDCFALYSNNTIKKISHKAEVSPGEVTRIHESDLINELMLNNVIDALKNNKIFDDMMNKSFDWENITDQG